ncbi:MAG: hypothetical protein ACTFAK_00890 [Candidatus Electronema sp. VV]|uniref:hypothetical protein n=1 Tax=Candidatus Electronema sp. V4 TaxID=3454756 RepID=UPI0040555A90
MWKKINLAMVLGLALSPPAAMAEGLFDPFAGIVEGIAQGMAQGLAVTEGIEMSSSGDVGSATGGNVVIGNSFAANEVRQSASTDSNVAMTMNLGSNNRQAVNLVQSEAAVLVMQGTAVGAGLNIGSTDSDYSVQAVNLITTCNGADCE